MDSLKEKSLDRPTDTASVESNSFVVQVTGLTPLDGRPSSGKSAFRPLELIILRLNDVCRAMGKGAFYIMPDRCELQFGHPCDFVFIDKVWNDLDKEEWDTAPCGSRLKMCDACES